VGRDDQLNEIDYYLEYAVTSARPISLAILGPRAAGKTSLLNMIEAKAKERGLCAVRIDLDESDVRTPLIFFHKLYDAVLLRAFEDGAFGGLSGETHRNYLDSVFGRADGTLGLLQFPSQYGLAMSRGNPDAPISDVAFVSDLQAIQVEAGKPFVLIFDECDVLKSSRPILQKVRNIFERTRRYMLVLCGTPDLFPEIDDVFSPMTRQFKKLVVGAFRDPSDTRRCIVAPLRKAGLDPTRVLELETIRDAREIHELTRGRPYEINLLCHHMFRRLQQGKANKMRLDLAVLEDLRLELEREQNLATRPVLGALRVLNDSGLRALMALVAADGTGTFKELWEGEYVFSGSSNWTQQDFRNWYEQFLQLGVLKDANGRVTFAGDEFERIYGSYLARERGIPRGFPPHSPVPLDAYWVIELTMWFLHYNCFRLGPSRRGDRAEELSADALLEVQNAMAGVVDSAELWEKQSRLVQDLYGLLILYRERDEVTVWRVRLRIGNVDVSVLLSGKALQGDDDERAQLERALDMVQVRLGELGGKLTVDEFALPVYRVESIVSMIEQRGSDKLRTELAGTHASTAMHYYVDHDDRKQARFHADLSYRYGADVWPSLLNNLGYIFLEGGDREKARNVLARAQRAAEGSEEQEALVEYNLGILEAQSGNLALALTHLETSIAKCESLDEEERRMFRLIVGNHDGTRLRFAEVNEPDLLVAARQTKRAIESTTPETAS